MAQVEQELAKVQDMKPQLDQLAKSQEILKEEKEQLELANQQNEEKSRVLEEKLTVVEQTKDQVDIISSSSFGFICFCKFIFYKIKQLTYKCCKFRLIEAS